MNFLKISGIFAIIFAILFFFELSKSKHTQSTELASKTPGQEAIMPVPQAPDNAAHRDAPLEGPGPN